MGDLKVVENRIDKKANGEECEEQSWKPHMNNMH